MKDLVEFVARELVDNPDAVEVTEEQDDRGLLIKLRVDPDDMGKVIGRSGRTARAIRSVVRAAAARQDLQVHVEIVD